MTRMSAFRKVPQAEALGEAKDAGLEQCLNFRHAPQRATLDPGLAKALTNLT